MLLPTVQKEDERGILVAEMSGNRNTGRQDQTRRLTWFDHVAIMDDKRLSTSVLYCHIEGTRTVAEEAEQRCRWKT